MPSRAAPPAPVDFRLYHGNDLEILAGILASELARPLPGQSVLAPETVLIPQPAMRRWLQKKLAETHGIAANLRFLAPGEIVREALDANVPGAGDASIGDAATMRWRLWSLLADPALQDEAVFLPLRPILGGDQPALAAWTLAGELATAFEKYQAWRRDWLRRWDQGADRNDWQAELWRRATRGLVHRGKRLDAYLSRFAIDAGLAPAGLPPRVFAFVTQNVSPDVLKVIISAAQGGTLHFFFLSPVEGWWGDLVTASERLREDATRVFADEENPLLRANGAAGRDFVRTLFADENVHPTFELARYVPPDPVQRTGLLHRLQRDLLARRPPPAADLLAPLPSFDDQARADPSLRVHSCHTRLREVQALHDQLRDLLESDSTLQPRDIAVLTPDIDQYGPHVHAVFGGSGVSSSQIPYALADGSAIATQPVAEAFMRLLALPGSRFVASEVLELLSVPAIAQHLQLEAADFDRLRDWLREAGARWGIDAAHRESVGAPAEPAFTWAWAIDRLLLGHASGDTADIVGVAPLPVMEGSAMAVFDSLLQGLQKLAQLQRSLAEPQPVARWQALLSDAIDSLFAARPIEPADGRALETLRGHIAAFGKQASNAKVDTPVPLTVVQSWFAQALGDSDARQPFLTGGVTFGRMVPMRLVPFRVICLLGMNDGEFPRRDPIGSLNRLSAELDTPRRQPGDRSIRDDDRGLFLQLFAAATDAFLISYLGQDPRSGDKVPPSVVVAELIDTASRYFADSDAVRKTLTVQHPLQPFAPEAFGRGDARRRSYQAQWRPAATPLAGDRHDLPRFATDLPARAMEHTQPLRVLSRNALFRGLANPSREYLSQRIGLRLPERGEALPDAEPFDSSDGLHRHALTQRLFDAAVAGQALDRDALFGRLLAEGLIAPGAAGLRDAREQWDLMAPAVLAWQDWGLDSARSLAYEIALDNGVTLAGTLPRVHATGLRQFSAGKNHGKTVLGLGIDALAWWAAGNCEPVRRVVRDEPVLVLAPMDAGEARRRLRALVDVFMEARGRALAFMPRAAHAWFHGGDESRAWSKALACWDSRSGFGEGDDAWVALALRGNDPFGEGGPAAELEFKTLATRVFGALPSAPAAGEGT